MKNYYTTVTLIILIGMFLSLGCSSKSEEPVYDVKANLERGWNSFAAGQYESSMATFHEVLNNDDNNAEARLGLGWSYAYLGNYSNAETNLLGAISNGLDGVDAHMGLATIYRDMPKYTTAISYSNDVLTNDSAYVFSKKPTIDYLDVHLIKAQVYFRMGSSYYSQVHVELKYLSEIQGLTAVPSQGNLGSAEYENILLERLEVLAELLSE